MTMKHLKILTVMVFAAVSLGANAQEKTDIFNPERNSVTSQTIAPDARAPVWAMWERRPTPT